MKFPRENHVRIFFDVDDGTGGGGGEGDPEPKAPVLPEPEAGTFLKGKEGDPEPEKKEAVAPVAERPDYVMEQFWDAEKGELRAESLAKSLKDTKAALDKKRDDSGVPTRTEGYYKVGEDGNVVLPEGLDALPPFPENDEVFSKFTEAAHKADFSKEQFDAAMGVYLGAMNDVYKAGTFDPQAVLDAVDPDPDRAENIIDGVNVYLEGLGLDEGALNAAAPLLATADGIHLIASIMQHHGIRPISIGAQVPNSPDKAAMINRWNELRNDPAQLDTNPILAKEFEDLGRKIHG